MKHFKNFLALIALLTPYVSVAQRQMSVHALDITRQTNLHDFTLILIHEKDTTTLVIPEENPPLVVLPDSSYQVIIQKAGYREADTHEWYCNADTAAVLIEFRLLREDATHREIRKGRRNARKMGIADFEGSENGGFRKIRAGMGRHFTSIVYIHTPDGQYSTHFVAEP